MNLPHAIAAIVFDLDGVLIDSEPLWEAARRDVVVTFGGVYTEHTTRDVMGMSAPEWSRYLRDTLRVPLDVERINEEVVARVAAAFRRDLPLMPRAVESVKRVAAMFTLALASSSNRSLIELVLELAHVRSLFSVVVSSEEVARGKPAPDVYVRAAELLGVAPESCIAIEDSSNGIRSASAAGMRVLAIPTAEHPPAPDARALAIEVFATLGDAVAYLENVQRLRVAAD